MIPGNLVLTPGTLTPFLFLTTPLLFTTVTISPFAWSISVTVKPTKPSSIKIVDPT